MLVLDQGLGIAVASGLSNYLIKTLSIAISFNTSLDISCENLPFIRLKSHKSLKVIGQFVLEYNVLMYG